MNISSLDQSYISPQNVFLKKTHPLHMSTQQNLHSNPGTTPSTTANNGVQSNFLNLVVNALEKVEQADVKANKMTIQAAIDPQSVELHQVLLASEKARFALSLTKNLADSFIRSYRDLSNVR